LRLLRRVTAILTKTHEKIVIEKVTVTRIQLEPSNLLADSERDIVNDVAIAFYTVFSRYASGGTRRSNGGYC
jgi:hypothetical protein